MTSFSDELLGYAGLAYNQLADPSAPHSLWTGDYWKVGCCLDTMIDYVRITKTPTGDTPGDILKLYERLAAGNGACWYDDFCWWAIACLKAYDPLAQGFFGQHLDKYQSIANDCWSSVESGHFSAHYRYAGAPRAWQTREGAGNPTPGGDPFDTPSGWAAPRFDGGVWQYELFYTRRDEGECSPSNPSDPRKVALGPFQLSVMNGLYLVLSARLGNSFAMGQQQGAAAAKRIEGFLGNWFGILPDGKALLPDELLLNRLPDGPGALVRERVSTYALLPDLTYHPKVQHYDKDAAWTGDQGLFIGGLVELDRYSDTPGWHQDTARSILDGVARALVDPSTGELRPYTTAGPFSNDIGDYKSGVGVFMRYLLAAFEQHTAMREAILDLVRSGGGEDFITKTARAQMQALKTGRWPTPTPSLFDPFNALATLTTASVIHRTLET